MKILHKLIDKYMIIRYGDLYGSHPLVRVFCYHRLEDKKGLHVKAFKYLKNMRKEKLDPLLEEEIFYHLFSSDLLLEWVKMISEKGEEFILFGYTNSLKKMIDKAREKGIEQAIFYLYYGDIAEIRGECNDALKYFERSYTFPSVDEKTSTRAYIKYGEILYKKGELKESLKYFEEGCDRCKKIDYQIGIARSINGLGLVLEKKGSLSNALDKFNKSLKILEKIGDKSGIATSLNNIGTVLYRKDDLDGALEKHRESLKIREEIGDKSGIAMSLNNIGTVLDKKENLDGALEKHRESLKIQEEIGNKLGIALSFHNIGTVYFNRKDYNSAIRNLFQSKALQNQMGIKERETSDYIFKVCKEVGRKRFEALKNEVFDKYQKN